MNDPYIGMPITMGRRCPAESDSPDSSHPRPPQNIHPPQDVEDVRPGFDTMYLGSLPLAMTYTPMQQWQQTYSDSVALSRGTLFPELDLPFDGRTILTEGLKGGRHR